MAECPICNESISFFSTSAMGVNYRGDYYQVCSENCAEVAKKEKSIEAGANLAALDEKSQAISAIRFVTSEAIPTLKVVSAFGTARGATVRSKLISQLA